MKKPRITLALCPFCGGNPHFVESLFPSGDAKIIVQCLQCQAQIAPEASRDHDLARAYAADRWNRRVKSTGRRVKPDAVTTLMMGWIENLDGEKTQELKQCT